MRNAVLLAELITTGDIERQGYTEGGLREYVASHELFQIEQFTLVDLERDAAAQAEGSTVSACAAANGSKEKDGVLGHVLLLKVKAGADSRERLHKHALIGYRTRVCQSADEARGEAGLRKHAPPYSKDTAIVRVGLSGYLLRKGCQRRVSAATPGGRWGERKNTHRVPVVLPVRQVNLGSLARLVFLLEPLPQGLQMIQVRVSPTITYHRAILRPYLPRPAAPLSSAASLIGRGGDTDTTLDRESNEPDRQSRVGGRASRSTRIASP